MYPHQIDRLTSALERDGLVALVATTAANVFYVTGFESPSHARYRTPQLAVWTPRGTALVVAAEDVPLVVTEGVEVDHVIGFGGFAYAHSASLGSEARRVRDLTETRAPSPAHALARALDALGVRQGRIGLDDGDLVPAAWEGLTAHLKGFTLAPAAAALRTARRVKSPYEIECLGRALGIAEEALNALVQTLKPGVTEREATDQYHAEVLRRDGALCPTTIAFGERTWIALPPPTERVLKAGDLVRFDVGAVFKGYHASLGRTAVMGEPASRHEATMAAIQAGLEAAIDSIRPGVTAGHVHEAARRETRAAGLAAFECERVGDGIGLEPREDPGLEAGDTTALETGEVLRVEVPYLEIGWGGVAMRDTVLVTTSSRHALNRSARGLVVLD